MKQAARRPRPPLPRPGLVLGVDDVLHGEAEFLDRGVELLGQTGVEQRVAQLLAHQEFCGQVADCLGVAVDHVGLGLEPGIHEVATHCGGRGDVHVGRLACSTVTPWVYFSCSRISSANCSAVTADFGAVISVINRLPLTDYSPGTLCLTPASLH